MDIRIPNLGEGADSGSVVSIFVKEGDKIAKDQTLIELENEKAVAPIPSTHAGVVTKLLVKVGDKVSVGQAILTLAQEGTSRAAAPKSGSETKLVAAPVRAPMGPPAVHPGVLLCRGDGKRAFIDAPHEVSRRR